MLFFTRSFPSSFCNDRCNEMVRPYTQPRAFVILILCSIIVTRINTVSCYPEDFSSRVPGVMLIGGSICLSSNGSPDQFALRFFATDLLP